MADQVDDDPQVALAKEHSRRERESLTRRLASGRRKCCQCNGKGSCIRCECVSAGRRCTDCLPLSRQRCKNVISPEETPATSAAGANDVNADLMASSQPAPSVGRTEDDNGTAATSVGDAGCVHPCLLSKFASCSRPEDECSPFDIDSKLEEVYGDRMLNGAGCVRSDCWFWWWERVVRLPFRRYDLPGGNVGRRFVDILTKEVELVASLKECSERLIVFQFVILQRESLVTKTADVRRMISKRLEMWAEGRYDAPFSEAVHGSESCGRRFSRSATPKNMTTPSESFTAS